VGLSAFGQAYAGLASNGDGDWEATSCISKTHIVKLRCRNTLKACNHWDVDGPVKSLEVGRNQDHARAPSNASPSTIKQRRHVSPTPRPAIKTKETWSQPL